MAGSLGKQSKGEAKEHSWYPALLNGMESLGCTWEEELPWGRVMRYRGADIAPVAKVQNEKSQSPPKPKTLPEWLLRNAPEERRPPRPLVPSQLGDDDYGDAPASAAMRTAAEKGRLIHALFERLTGDNLTTNLVLAEEWLARNNRDPSIQNDAVITSVRDVVENPDWQVFFGPNARAEVPLAAVVGETVITGRVDRLVIEPGLIRVLDFKTGRGVPFDANTVSRPYLRQMAHYVAALETIFVGSKVEASLLFTYAPILIQLSGDILAPHKPLL
jgi:ATP-dependent helicase/nuclease subunit A